MDLNNPDTWLENIWPQPRTQQSIKNNDDINTHQNIPSTDSTIQITFPWTFFNGEVETPPETRNVPVCKISGTIVDVQWRKVILEKWRVIAGDSKWDFWDHCLWCPEKVYDYFAKIPKVWDTLSVIIDERNELVKNEKNMKNYHNIDECSLATVQAQSLKLFPDLAKWDIEALDAKVLGTKPTSQKGKFADYCQLNETVLATKSSFLKNGKGITTAFIFQNDEGDIFTAREQIPFSLKKNTTLLSHFELAYKELNGKKMHVIVDRNNKNTILGEYTSADKNLPWCVPQSTQENNIFPIFWNISSGWGGIFLTFLMILTILLLGTFAKKAKTVTFEKI